MNSSPGKTQVKQVREGLSLLPKRLKTAFAVACAERAIPIVARYSSLTMAQQALEMAWRFASGEHLEDADVRGLLSRYDAVINEHYDSGETDFVLAAAFAPYHALHSVLSAPDYDGSDYAFGSASDAAEVGDRASGGVHVEEELNWQLEALSIASAWQDDLAQRDMFDRIASTPAWLEKFRALHSASAKR